MPGDFWLTASILALDLALLPTVIDRKTSVHWFTGAIYTAAMFVAVLGFASNDQTWPFVLQLIAFAEWAILTIIAIGRRFTL